MNEMKVCPYCLGIYKKNNHIEKKHPNGEITFILCSYCNGHIPVQDILQHLKKKHKLEKVPTIEELKKNQASIIKQIIIQKQKKKEKLELIEVKRKKYQQFRDTLTEAGQRSIRHGLIHVPLPAEAYKKYKYQESTWTPTGSLRREKIHAVVISKAKKGIRYLLRLRTDDGYIIERLASNNLNLIIGAKYNFIVKVDSAIRVIIEADRIL